MMVLSSDDKQHIDIGSAGIWNSVLSTAEVHLAPIKNKIRLALDFLNTGRCNSENAFETARQFNLIRDAFSQIPPSKAIYDKDNLSIAAPWSNNLSEIVTSCGNLYTTSDGKDLLFEVVSILTYAHYLEVDVLAYGWK
jgi:hypothetical protein